MKVDLTEDEENLRKEIEERYERIKEAFRASIGIVPEVGSLIFETGERAHRLHMMLKLRGREPKHHGYMLKNREVPADHPDFYMHYHPIEDLLKFLQDDGANADPSDQTLGREFTFRVYSNRWGHEDTYRVRRMVSGWDVRHAAIGGPCDKGGRPFLFENFRQDFIEYPNGLDGRLEWLWQVAADRGLPSTAVQEALQQLADWVSATERSAPHAGVWEGY